MTTTPTPAEQLPPATPDQQTPPPEASFAETALKLGGKSDEEARRTGAIDRADDQVEQLFKPRVSDDQQPDPSGRVGPLAAGRAVRGGLRKHAARRAAGDDRSRWRSSAVIKAAGTLYNADDKIAEPVLSDLAGAGYWGLFVDRQYGGYGAPLRSFMPFLTQMALVEPTIAGLASVHGCIGAVDPVRTFGSEEQKRRFLPQLASGERLSAFALTEPGAGSDLTALRTRAKLDGDHYLVTGEKLFITNVVPGRTIGLVCLIDDKPAVLICRSAAQRERAVPARKSTACTRLKHAYNQGIIFRDFPVPAENLLRVPKGNGLTIAYHGLNLGRVALCATAAGNMRLMMASMIPWAQFRHTYGEAIAHRELVRRRLGRLAGLIVGVRRPRRLVLDAPRSRLPRRDGMHRRQNLRQRIAKRSRHRAVHENARRPVVSARAPVRRPRARVPRPVHLRRRRRDARHGPLQIARQAARHGSFSSRSARPSSPPG